MLFSVILCLTTQNPPFDAVYQQQLMDIAFVLLSPSFINEINPRKNKDCCRWGGVECSNGIISKIAYRAFSFGPMDIQFLPSSIQFLFINSCGQRGLLETRTLPAQVRILYLQNNSYEGSVELRTLPDHMLALDLSNNNLYGRIALTHLPQGIAFISLADNLFGGVRAYYGDVPVSVKRISLNSKKTEGQPQPKATHARSGVDEDAVFSTNEWRLPAEMTRVAYWKNVYK